MTSNTKFHKIRILNKQQLFLARKANLLQKVQRPCFINDQNYGPLTLDVDQIANLLNFSHRYQIIVGSKKEQSVQTENFRNLLFYFPKEKRVNIAVEFNNEIDIKFIELMCLQEFPPQSWAIVLNSLTIFDNIETSDQAIKCFTAITKTNDLLICNSKFSTKIDYSQINQVSYKIYLKQIRLKAHREKALEQSRSLIQNLLMFCEIKRLDILERSEMKCWNLDPKNTLEKLTILDSKIYNDQNQEHLYQLIPQQVIKQLQYLEYDMRQDDFETIWLFVQKCPKLEFIQLYCKLDVDEFSVSKILKFAFNLKQFQRLKIQCDQIQLLTKDEAIQRLDHNLINEEREIIEDLQKQYKCRIGGKMTFKGKILSITMLQSKLQFQIQADFSNQKALYCLF